MTFILLESISFCFDFHLCQVDTGFTLVAGVVADVKHIIVPKVSGITSIAAAGQFYQFFHCAVLDINVGQCGMGTALVHSASSNPVSAGYADEVRPAETVKISAEVFPLPLLIVRPAYSQECTG